MEGMGLVLFGGFRFLVFFGTRAAEPSSAALRTEFSASSSAGSGQELTVTTPAVSVTSLSAVKSTVSWQVAAVPPTRAFGLEFSVDTSAGPLGTEFDATSSLPANLATETKIQSFVDTETERADSPSGTADTECAAHSFAILGTEATVHSPAALGREPSPPSSAPSRRSVGFCGDTMES